ncbi:hypothetical protein ACFLQ2_04825 [archaeon]
MAFGIPDEVLLGGVAAIALLVVALKFLAGRNEAPKYHRHHSHGEPEAEGVKPEDHTELEDMINPKAKVKGTESAATVEEEETAGMSVETEGLEALLARPIDEAPSIGPEHKTNVDAGLEQLKFEGEPSAAPDVPPEIKHEMKQEKAEEKPVPATAKDLARLREQFGEEYDIDRLGEIVAVPEARPKYTPPKDIEEKAEAEASKERPAKLYDRAKKDRAENLERYCMLQYDAGKSPRKVDGLLRVKGLNANASKQMAFKNYRVWIEKREPIIREIKETRDMIKRIEYKFLKQQIDGVTRKSSLNEANKKIAGLEAKLKSSEDYFD